MSEESRNAGKDLRDSEITDAIIAAAIAVHRELGPGFLESIYEQALAVEFALRGIAFIRQKPFRFSTVITRSANTGSILLSKTKSSSN